MTARHLILGLDGADLQLVYALGRNRLPNLFGLMDRGVFAHQESVRPPATLPNWTTFLTGVGPGEHGVFDFTTRRGYRVKFSAGTVREAPTWIARLDRMGMRCACIGFPATWPPEPLANGIFMSGWDAPVSFEADRSFVWPRALYDTLWRRFGPLRFDEVDEFHADRPGWHGALGRRLADKVARRSELASFLLAMRAWDVFAFYFGESDTASHYLYSLYDEGSPRRPRDVTPEQAAGLPLVYESLDQALGRLIAEAGEGAEVTVLSDHGFGGSSDKMLYLNRALAEAGLLAFKPASRRAAAATSLKDLALGLLGPALRAKLFRLGGTVLPSWLESEARFGAIDMDRTLAFSDELNYFPAVHLNLRGREPRGRVDPTDAERVRAQVIEALLSLRDPERDRPVVERVYPREDLFDGPFVSRAPDLLVELRLDRGYSYNLMPSSRATSPAVIERMPESELLGKKGRSLPGSHRQQGLFVAAGPQVLPRGRIALGIEDASAMVLARLGAAPPPRSRGRVIEGTLLARDQATSTLPALARPPRKAFDAAALETRLRALGYID